MILKTWNPKRVRYLDKPKITQVKQWNPKRVRYLDEPRITQEKSGAKMLLVATEELGHQRGPG